MAYQLQKLKLENFRLYKEAELDFSKLNLLIGGNSSGKSTVSKALLLLENSLRYHNWTKLTFGEGIDSLGSFKSVLNRDCDSSSDSIRFELLFCKMRNNEKRREDSILEKIEEVSLCLGYGGERDNRQEYKNGVLNEFNLSIKDTDGFKYNIIKGSLSTNKLEVHPKFIIDSIFKDSSFQFPLLVYPIWDGLSKEEKQQVVNTHKENVNKMYSSFIDMLMKDTSNQTEFKKHYLWPHYKDFYKEDSLEELRNKILDDGTLELSSINESTLRSAVYSQLLKAVKKFYSEAAFQRTGVQFSQSNINQNQYILGELIDSFAFWKDLLGTGIDYDELLSTVFFETKGANGWALALNELQDSTTFKKLTIRDILKSGRNKIKSFYSKIEKQYDLFLDKSGEDYENYVFDIGEVLEELSDEHVLEFENLKRDVNSHGFDPEITESIRVNGENYFEKIMSMLSLDYISSKRGYQQHVYFASEENEYHIGQALSSMLKVQNKRSGRYKRPRQNRRSVTNEYDFIQKWAKKFNLIENGQEFFVKQLEGSYVQALIGNPAKPEEALNLADRGFGHTQLVPLIIQTAIYAFSEKKGMLIIEEPGIHLHPDLQAKLVDFMVDAISYGVQFLVETHSEYFIHKLRVMVINDNETKALLDPKDVFIHSIDQGKTDSIRIFENGDLDKELPESFYNQSTYLLKELEKKKEQRAWIKSMNDIGGIDKPTLFVEGPTDQQVLKAVFKKLGYDDECINVIDSKGSSKVLNQLLQWEYSTRKSKAVGLIDYEEETIKQKKTYEEKKPKRNNYKVKLIYIKDYSSSESIVSTIKKITPQCSIALEEFYPLDVWMFIIGKGLVEYNEDAEWGFEKCFDGNGHNIKTINEVIKVCKRTKKDFVEEQLGNLNWIDIKAAKIIYTAKVSNDGKEEAAKFYVKNIDKEGFIDAFKPLCEHIAKELGLKPKPQ
ncbi:AAA family ATPase [Saprospira grandis]|uniref:Uncharacterized protein n=1 Tax=Saprospira grandis (strain Lewin) TaxID=984262 RepID=H6L652_SAPGL|nr:AAA family ATPase [Saprospira grandis]AFC22953.1 hypothetical protein SGRA_0212 [Saprospira grandis str. Lewin]